MFAQNSPRVISVIFGYLTILEMYIQECPDIYFLYNHVNRRNKFSCVSSYFEVDVAKGCFETPLSAGVQCGIQSNKIHDCTKNSN